MRPFVGSPVSCRLGRVHVGRMSVGPCSCRSQSAIRRPPSASDARRSASRGDGHQPFRDPPPRGKQQSRRERDPRQSHDRQETLLAHDRRKRQVPCRSSISNDRPVAVFHQVGTDKNPAGTDTIPESLHLCREAGKMANAPPTWRTRGERAGDMTNETGPTPVAAHPGAPSDRRSQRPLPAALRLTEQPRRRTRYRSRPTPPT